jgi:hypothetical protein
MISFHSPEVRVAIMIQRLIPYIDRSVAYGAGTLMTVFTIVIDGPKDNILPLMVVTAATPTVETEAPAWAMMVPVIVPPPRIPLIVAKLPTCQKTFFA